MIVSLKMNLKEYDLLLSNKNYMLVSVYLLKITIVYWNQDFLNIRSVDARPITSFSDR